MKKILFAICFVVLCAQVHSQALYRFGSPYHDRARKIIQTQDGNFLIVGMTDGFGSDGNAFTMKVSPSGMIIWVRDYAGINTEEIYDVFENADGSLVYCGYTHSYGAGQNDAFLMKTNHLGVMDWAWAYGNIDGEIFYRVVSDGAGGYYALAIMNNGFDGGISITKISSFGDIVWNKWTTLAYPELYWPGVALMLSSSGDAIFAVSDGSSSNAIHIYRVNAAGTTVWSKSYTPQPSSGGTRGLFIDESPTGDIFLNYSYQFSSPSATLSDICVMKLNSSGTYLSNKAYGGSYYDHSADIIATPDGGFVIAGTQNSAGNGADDACLIKVRADNTVAWARAYGTEWDERCVSVVRTSDQGYAFTGQTISSGYDYDSLKVFFGKTDSVGQTICNDLAWTPQVTNLSVASGTANALIDLTLVKNQILWPANNRSMYSNNLCVPDAIAGVQDLQDLRVYPNPFTSSLRIRYDSREGRGCEVIIHSLLGAEVFRKQLPAGEDELDLSFLPPGMYVCEVIDGESRRGMQKIIRQQ